MKIDNNSLTMPCSNPNCPHHSTVAMIANYCCDECATDCIEKNEFEKSFKTRKKFLNQARNKRIKSKIHARCILEKYLGERGKTENHAISRDIQIN